METYDARADRWFLTQASEVAPRAYHGLVAVDHKIYLIGGKFVTIQIWGNGGNGMGFILFLIENPELWFLFQGFDGAEHFNTVRCFDPTTLTWTHKANMHFPRCYISCCVLSKFKAWAASLNLSLLSTAE